METNYDDQHLIDELHSQNIKIQSLKSQLSEYEIKYNEQCKRIYDLNTVIADREERVKALEGYLGRIKAECNRPEDEPCNITYIEYQVEKALNP